MTNRALVDGVFEHEAHIVIVPLFAQGHIIPITDVARLLAERGVRVTFITSPVNASRMKFIIDHVHRSGLPINFVELPFPCAAAGLPEGCESVDLVPSLDLFINFFFEAGNLLRRPLEQYLRELVIRPSCMIYDMCIPWAAQAARELDIPRLVFHGPSCLYILCSQVFYDHKIYQKDTDIFEPITVPDMPLAIQVSKAHCAGWFDLSGYGKVCEDIHEAEASADGVVMNTCDELEMMFVETYKKVIGKNVWTVGPLCLCDKDSEAKMARGNKAAVDWHRMLSWLDSMEPSSVLYVSFGSVARAKAAQLIEIGLGLEASNRPFIWVVKEVEKLPEMEKWMEEEGFEERVSSRGLVISGWAPQVVILSHPAVGGFVTHCGWNSTLEAVSAGVPMITWPHFADQFLNERLVVDFMRIGVPIGIKKPVLYSVEDEVPVKRHDVEKAVRSLMDDGEEAEDRRARARELQDKVSKATGEGGSSYENITSLIEYFNKQQSLSERTKRASGERC